MSGRRGRRGGGRIYRPESWDLPRRRQRLGRWALALGILVFVFSIGSALMARGGDSPDLAALEALPDVAALQATQPEQYPLVRVDRVVDGDTLAVSVAGERLDVRLFGVDAPERGKPCYDEATEALRALAGDEVRLRPDARLQDSFGRALRYVYAPDGASIDAALVRGGYATAWREDGALLEALVALEGQAQAAGEGCLWR